MGSITSLKCVLTQEHLDAICAKYFVPEEVHPQLPSSDATMHERPVGKVGMYTRFFDYANYRIPFSTFFVSVLTHFRIPVNLFRYFYTHNYKNGWFGFTKRPNVRACYSKNLDSVKNWNDHFFWVDEFVVPANARFSWFLGSNIVKDRAPAPSEYNVSMLMPLLLKASIFLRVPEEFLCWVGISRNYLLNKDTYPRFEYENGEGGSYFPDGARAENERWGLLKEQELKMKGLLSRSQRKEREFAGDASVGDGEDQGFDSVSGQDNVEPTVPVTAHVETEIPGPKRTKKKRVIRGSERMPDASHPPKRSRADYGTTGGFATGGKSPSVLNRLLQDSRLMVEQGVPALPTLPFITSSVTASPLEEGEDHTDSVTGPSLRTVGPSERFVVLSDSSHHSGAKSADPEVDSLVRSAVPVMTEATTVTTIATTVAIPTDVGKDKSAPHPSVFGSSSSSEKTDRTLSLFTGRSGSGFATGSIRTEEVIGASLEEIYVPEWTVTKGFELNDGHSCANMIDHFTPPAFFKTVRGMEHEQLFAEFNVSAARNLSLSSEVRMRAEYNILEKRKWKSLAEEKDCLLGPRDKEIVELKSQLLKAKEESVEVAQLRARVSGLEATEGSLRGEVASAKEHNGLLEQECGSLKLKVTSLESTIAEKDRELSDLGASSSSLKSQNQSLVNQVHELKTSSTGLREKLADCYEEAMQRLEDFKDNLWRPSRLGRRWLLTHRMQLLMAKCLNSTEYMEALGSFWPCYRERNAGEICRGRAVRMTDLQPDVSQLMVPVHHKQDKVVIGSQALSVALDIFRRRLILLSAEALIEPPVEVPATNVLSTVVIVPHSDPSVSVEDYDNPDLVDVVPKNVTPGPEGEEKINASAGGDFTFSKLDDEARDAVL
ncbi:hypothetical protein Tco_0627970 [Tanacetum coccineum]|uniref:Transposase (Putative), gypsy type n=1 Tax=Tanacetum coccineum TaxID=301880 RepID=A0ABQ4WP55_9ASTR